MDASLPRRRVLVVAGSVLTVGGAGCLETFDRSDDGAAAGESSEADDKSPESAVESPESDGENGTQPTRHSGGDDVLYTIERGDRVSEAVTLDQIETIGEPTYDAHRNSYAVSIELTSEGTDDFVSSLDALGALEDPESTEIHTHFDGEVIATHTLGAELAQSMRSGEYDGSQVVTFSEQAPAQEFYVEVTGN